MKKVAKLVLVDASDNYLLIYRNNHPTFGKDVDLPGGTLEEGESTLQTMLREVKEEIGLAVGESSVRKLYVGTTYSRHGTQYVLYAAVCDSRPEITLSWEHSGYEWLPVEEFIEKVKHANDTYMHMAGDVILKQKQIKGRM